VKGRNLTGKVAERGDDIEAREINPRGPQAVLGQRCLLPTLAAFRPKAIRKGSPGQVDRAAITLL